MSCARVAVIVVAHDGGRGLAACIAALRASSYRHLVIVVVDNASVDGCVVACSDDVDAVLRLDSNRGFAGGVNAGIAHHDGCYGRADVYALVNQDCVVAADWLEPLVATLASDPRVAVVGARIYEADGRTLQHAGARIAPNGLTEHLGRGTTDTSAYREPCEVDYVTGAVCAMRDDTWRAHGPLDESYFPAYFEEVDFCVRCREAGLRIVYQPRSRACHTEAGVLGRGTQSFLRAYHTNRMRFAAAHLLVRGRALAALRAEVSWLLGRRRVSEIRPALAAYRALPGFVLSSRRRRIGRAP